MSDSKRDRLYKAKVTLEFDICVVARDGVEAQQIAAESATCELDNYSLDQIMSIWPVTEITNIYMIPDHWSGSYPWYYDGIDEGLTVKELVPVMQDRLKQAAHDEEMKRRQIVIPGIEEAQ